MTGPMFNISITIDNEIKEKLDRISKKFDCNISQTIRHIVREFKD